MKDLVSVIVPAYNVENYLKTCIESLQNQTYAHLEILIVDDGSSDDTLNVCKQFSRLDDRIFVIHQENQGQCVARNAALDCCRGEYIMFVDSDDYIHPKMIECLLCSMKENNLDFIRCPYVEVDEDESCCLEIEEDSQSLQIFDQHEIIRNFLTAPFSNRKCFTALVTAALYNAKLFQTIRFPVGLIFEEGYVLPDVFFSSNRAGFLDFSMYYNRKNPQSTTSIQTEISDKGIRSVDDWKYIHFKIKEKYPEFNSITCNRWVKKYLSVLNALYMHPDSDRDGTYKTKLRKELCDNQSYFKEVGVDKTFLKQINTLKYGNGICGLLRRIVHP